jgi:ribosomal protein L37E
MSQPDQPKPGARPITPLKSSIPTKAADDKTLCERCGADMYRMHAVWRCSSCGFKTDCCGW